MSKQTGGVLDFDVAKLLGDLKIPGVDIERLVDAQRKNISALTEANKLAYDGFQAVLRRQGEIIRQAIEETSKAAREFNQVSNPQDRAIINTELAKDAFERSLSNARELSEIIAKSNSEAFDLLNKRYVQILNEIKDSLSKK